MDLCKGDSISLGPGGTFCLLGDSYSHFIYFNSLPSERDDADDEPRAKKARCDTLSDSDDDLTSEDLEDIRREFGQEMVEKIQWQKETKFDCSTEEIASHSLKESWEDIEGRLIIFTSSETEARSKVLLLGIKLLFLDIILIKILVTS